MTENNFMEKIKNSYKEYTPVWIIGAIILVLAVIAVASPWDKKENKNKVERPRGCEPGFKFDVYTGLPCPREEDIIDEEDEVADEDEDGNNEEGEDTAPSPTAPSAPATTAPARNASGKFPSLSEALEIYKGNTFAVKAGCAIAPGSQTVSAGIRIMVHNDTTASHTVRVGSQTLFLKPYYYRTVLLTAPGSVSVSCDGKQASTITVK